MNDATPDQRWIPVRGFEPYYLIGERGGAFSTRTGKVLKPSYSNTGGYPMVIITVNGVRTPKYNHVMVAEAFIGECPEGEQVRHKDGNPRNPAASNLEYGTSSDNKYDQVRHGTHYEASRDHCDNGHEFTEANARIDYWPDGSFKQRVCRACANDRYKAWGKRNAESGRECSRTDCTKSPIAKGLCRTHYGRQWRAAQDKASQSLLNK